MIPVLRSLDNLLNRFDELSQKHTSLISDFETNFTDIENPLHDVIRDENERRRTSENLLKLTMEDDDDEQFGSHATIEDFHRRLSKSRCGNRPPNYVSNENNSFYNRIQSRNSWATTQSAPLPQTTTTTTKNSFQTIRTKSNENLLDQKTPTTMRTRGANPPIENLTPLRRNARSAITTFTLETAIRLSKPRVIHQSMEDKLSPKRIQRRIKYFQSPKKETTQSSNTSIPKSAPPPPSTLPVQRPLLSTSQPKSKRTNPTTVKSTPKKQKIDSKMHVDNSKRIPMSNYPRPAVLLTAPPTISLTFPMQPELNSSRVIVQPKPANPPKKTTNIFTNKRSIIPTNRLLYLMT